MRPALRTLLDASQAIGHVPVRPGEVGADLVAFPGHKGLRGPSGTGALYVAPEVELSPLMVGGTGVHSESPFQPHEMPVRLEAGTPNALSCAGLAAALSWFAQEGEARAEEGQRLGRLLSEGLSEIPGVRLHGVNGHARLPVLSFAIEAQPVEETGRRLTEEYGILCRTGLHCAPLLHEALGSAPEGTVRLSVSGFNTEEEVLFCLDAIANMAKECSN